jgi:hypothetical protein
VLTTDAAGEGGVGVRVWQEIIKHIAHTTGTQNQKNFMPQQCLIAPNTASWAVGGGTTWWGEAPDEPAREYARPTKNYLVHHG